MKSKWAVLIMIFLIFSSSEVILVANQWTNTSSKDPMTGEEQWYAISPSINSTSKMSFPYGNTQAL